MVHGEASSYHANRLRTLWHSTIGKKYIAAITGLILAVWIVLHMLGNLKAIEGPGHGHPAIDSYAHFLRRLGSPVLPHDFALWVERGVLLGALVLHVSAVVALWRRNRAAKPARHRARRIRSTIAARTMTITGVLILAFLIFHILHFTTRTIHPTPLIDERVYANAYAAFHRWYLVVIYLGAVVLLGFHLNHALWSGAQTAGWDDDDRNWLWRRLATTVTVLTVVGFAVIPILFATDALPRPSSQVAHANVGVHQ